MIRKILTTYTSKLEEYLSKSHRCPEELATVGSIGNSTEALPNKLMVCLMNVEQESSGEIMASAQKPTDGYVCQQPPLLLNLNIILAAVYDKRRYEESLSVLSDALQFIHSTPKFQVGGSDYTIEIATLSTQDMNNVWALMGGQYYPSVICKIRGLTIGSESMVK
mgnify:CR=1 FL=1